MLVLNRWLGRLEKFLDDEVWLATSLIIRVTRGTGDQWYIFFRPSFHSVRFISATVLLCRGWLLNYFVPRSGVPRICTLTNVCDPNSAYINLFWRDQDTSRWTSKVAYGFSQHITSTDPGEPRECLLILIASSFFPRTDASAYAFDSNTPNATSCSTLLPSCQVAILAVSWRVLWVLLPAG